MPNIITNIQVSGVTYTLSAETSGGTVDQTIESGSTNAVAGGAVYDKFDEVEQVTARALNDLNEKKQDVLSAGTNITISGNVISAEGGSVTVDTALDSGSTNPVQNKVIYNKIDEVEEVTAAGLNALNDKITPTVELTQAEYDALVSAGTVSAGTYYIITDATAFDPSTKVDTSAFTTYSAATNAALNNKVDKSAVVSAVTSASTDSEIPTAKAVWEAASGGGSTYTAGRGISITTGATADTVSFNLPISAGTGTYSIKCGETSAASGSDSFAIGGNGVKASGIASFAGGSYSEANGIFSMAFGRYSITNNYGEVALGFFNKSNGSSSAAGNSSGNTLFSVGNGTNNTSSARHNAFEVRQNGDIYCSDGTNDVKLQDTITATTANTTALGGLSLVKLTQAQYDALSPNYDSNTLYVIVN